MSHNLDYALQYAARGWRVFPLHHVRFTIDNLAQCSCPKGVECGRNVGKHPRVKGGFKTATTDRSQIEAWWAKWPDAGIGLATGAGLTVLDADGEKGRLQVAAWAAEHSDFVNTLAVRTGNGAHLYFQDTTGTRSSAHDGLDVRGEGGYVVAPPTMHRSGRQYAWVDTCMPLLALPEWLRQWMVVDQSRKPSTGKEAVPRTESSLASFGPVPPHLQANESRIQKSEVIRPVSVLDALPEWSPYEENRLRSALAAIPANLHGKTWHNFGRALFDLQWVDQGENVGFELWDEWSETATGRADGGGFYRGREDLEGRWLSFRTDTLTENRVSIKSIYKLARERGWSDIVAVDPTPENLKIVNGSHALPEVLTEANLVGPLIKLNEKHAVIADMGGKCLVMGFVPSKVDPTLRVPSFQTFKSFSERYANQYVKVQGGEKTEPKQLGAYWLKWTGRRSYEGIDLEPRGTVPEGVLNLWTGFAVEPKPGSWAKMQEHICNNLACGDAKSAEYIFKFAAWCVQHPGERAEVALVFKGEKGSGKSTFGDALVKLFGAHGLHIHSSKHLVGTFNGHLRNCLLLFADEAFWAGDKQGESTLKGLVTDRLLTIEQKGIDAVPWQNRLHVIMAANADWVVPASHNERRYAVFDVGAGRIGDRAYWAALHNEMQDGGLAAMLHDLQRVKLGGWHPREIIESPALQRQKEHSLDHRQEWWHETLQSGFLPCRKVDGAAAASTLLEVARSSSSKLRDLTATALGRFLRAAGCEREHRRDGNYWLVPNILDARQYWETRYGKWAWEAPLAEWNAPG